MENYRVATRLIKEVGIPISKKQHYQALLQSVGNAHVVMIGEASHGTKEFYEQRAEITKLLIQEKGFSCIAVEADWPDAYRINRYVQKGKSCRDKDAKESLGDFKRFPMWMWRNVVVDDFVEWLRKHNDKTHDPKGKVAFYGMDLYSFYTSMDAVIEYLQKVSPKDADKAKASYSLFERFQGEPSNYGFAAGVGFAPSLENEVVKTLSDIRVKGEEYLKGVGGLIDGDELFYATQNAELVKNAEEYYRKMYHADVRTWNIRDKHMADCVENLLDFHSKKHGGGDHKIVIWAHNSHLGDARATDSGNRRGEWNVGQLIREKYGIENTFNIGFSTHKGTVTAADEWDDPAALFYLKPGMKGSYEELFHDALVQTQEGKEEGNIPFDEEGFCLVFRSNGELPIPKEASSDHKKLVKALSHPPRLERYVGVIYKPATEKASHYSNSCLPQEYDAVIYIDETTALEPLDHTQLWKGKNEFNKRVVTSSISTK